VPRIRDAPAPRQDVGRPGGEGRIDATVHVAHSCIHCIRSSRSSYNPNICSRPEQEMVKIPNRPPTPIGPREPVGPPPPPHVCPDIEVDVPLDSGVSVQAGDRVAVQVRDGRVRVGVRGQVIGWVTAREPVEAIRACQEGGGSYVGHVSSLQGRTAVVALEGRRQ